MFVLTKKSLIIITAAIPKGPAIHITPGNFQVPINTWVEDGKCWLMSCLESIGITLPWEAQFGHRDFIAKAHN